MALALNGLALGALGPIQYGLTRFRNSFLTVALLIIVLAVSIGILQLAVARASRNLRHVAGAWFLALAGVASFGIAVTFRNAGEGKRRRVVSATEFKAKCLALMDEIGRKGGTITVTKRGRPMATVGPVQKRRRPSSEGAWRGKVRIPDGQLTADMSHLWEAARKK